VRRRRSALVCAALLSVAIAGGTAASPGLSLIKTPDLKEWLSYIASDQLQGRATYSAGLGLAAAYIEDHLREWDVKPAGDAGSYLQTVRVRSVRATSASTVTVRAGGRTRTFKDGEGVIFQRNAGGSRTLTIDRVEFAGYGLDVPASSHTDLRGKDVRGAAVVWLGSRGPRGLDPQLYRRVLNARSRHAIEDLHAAATLAPGSTSTESTQTFSGAGVPPPDFVSAERLDHPVPPAVTVDDTFLEFLFSTASTPYRELKRRAEAQEALPSFRLDGVTVTFNIDVTYEVIRTQLTQNVIGLVEGSDPRLKASYVAFGAHYDHVGYADTGSGQSGTFQPPTYGRLAPGAADDRIWNGADDDGSGTVAVMALARAFAAGPKPRRSLLFVWHAAEEIGTYGSRYFADYPTVPVDQIVAQLNIDMIGRNRDDKASESNTVYLVGSDRISSELHDINRDANRALPAPMTLDYELNDPSDPEQLYYRSDHYSYAAKGIPVIFFTTGLHPDYHTNTDDVSKILFDKMTRVVQLIFETGVRVANLDHPPVRDNRGPRTEK
jgi:Peptidase family M28